MAINGSAVGVGITMTLPATIRLAIVPRRPRSGIVSLTPSGEGARAAAHAATSRSTMRPPGPVPVI